MASPRPPAVWPADNNETAEASSSLRTPASRKRISWATLPSEDCDVFLDSDSMCGSAESDQATSASGNSGRIRTSADIRARNATLIRLNPSFRYSSTVSEPAITFAESISTSTRLRKRRSDIATPTSLEVEQYNNYQAEQRAKALAEIEFSDILLHSSGEAIPSLPRQDVLYANQTDPIDWTLDVATGSESTPASETALTSDCTEASDLREADAAFCQTHFPGRTFYRTGEDAIAQMFMRLGGPKHADTFKALAKRMRAVPDAGWEQVEILKAYHAEAKTHKKEDDNSAKYIPNASGEKQYWLDFLSDKAGGPFSFNQYQPQGFDVLRSRLGSYTKIRKYDAVLRPSSVGETWLENVLVSIDFTEQNPPAALVKPSAASQDVSSTKKLQQSFTNSVDLLVYGPSRLLVPAISIHGKGENALLVFHILSHEGAEYCLLKNCLGLNLYMTAAILAHLRSSSIYQLGFNPLFGYALDAKSHTLSPITLYRPSGGIQATLNPNAKTLSRISHDPFSRSTWVIPAAMEASQQGGKQIIVKTAHISDARLGREGKILKALTQGQPILHVPVPVAAYAALSNYSNLRPNIDQLSIQRKTTSRFHSRHLEVYVFDVPVGTPLSEVTDLDLFVELVCQLFEVILAAYERGVLHRDLSTGNILVHEKRVYVIDWECGKLLNAAPSDNTPELSGTLETMAIWRLREYPCMSLASEAESATYVAMKSLLKICQENSNTNICERLLRAHRWSGPAPERDLLASLRWRLWSEGHKGIVYKFEQSGHQHAADVVKALFHTDFFHLQPNLEIGETGPPQLQADQEAADKIRDHIIRLRQFVRDRQQGDVMQQDVH